MSSSPTYKDFLLLWKQFTDMALTHGITKAALSGNSKHHWSFYYFYGNNYEAHGQTLLEYCISNGLEDVLCTMELSEFGMTGYRLEPKASHHDEEVGIFRQATDIQDLHFSSVDDLNELEEVLTSMLEAEGSLKVIAACQTDVHSPVEYREMFKGLVSSSILQKESVESEYILFLPFFEDQLDIKWKYLVLDSYGNELEEGCV